MYARIKSYTSFGLETTLVDVEVAVSPGLPRFDIIGLPDAAIRESKERIFQSLRTFDYGLPPGGITVNLAPAEIRKKGATFDLAIAIGLLLASGQIKPTLDLSTFVVAGELSLDGRLHRLTGLFGAGLKLPEIGLNDFLIPKSNLKELSSFRALKVFAADDLGEAIEVIEGVRTATEPPEQNLSNPTPVISSLDYDQLYGNEIAIRAVQLSLLANLNLLLIGPPGCGKSMILKRLPTLFTPLSLQESQEVTRIHSSGGKADSGLIQTPPFREVHSTVSLVSLIGGGSNPTPGEISYAHRGVLFLDELCEFPRVHLQALRTPLENKNITISRINYQILFPAQFILAAAANPCPCGYYGHPSGRCQCHPQRIEGYMGRISGPVLDRIELIVGVDPPKEGDLFKKSSRSSATLRSEILEAKEKLNRTPDLFKVERLQVLLDESLWMQKIFKHAYSQGFLSLRRVTAVLKTALALSLLEAKPLGEEQLFSALQFTRIRWKTD